MFYLVHTVSACMFYLVHTSAFQGRWQPSKLSVFTCSENLFLLASRPFCPTETIAALHQPYRLPCTHTQSL